jgi:UDP-glucose 4-epimerase
MNKIIILGCGYIGTNLANYIYLHFKEEVYVLGIENEYNDYLNSNIKFLSKRIEQININDKELFENAIVIDAVGNLNATNSTINSTSLFLTNCANKVELVNMLNSLKIKKYIFLSSGGTVYNDSNEPHNEDENLNPQSIYALEKEIVEKYLKIANLENPKFNYLVLRLSNPYGGITSKFKKQGIIDVAISKISKNEELEFYGDLKNVRDYIYIDNLSEYIYKIAVSEARNDIFNIGTGIGYSVENLFKIIEKVYSKNVILKYEKIDTVNIKCNILNIDKIKSYVKLQKSYSLEEGIELIKKLR